jgi:MoxR-like ATPase
MSLSSASSPPVVSEADAARAAEVAASIVTNVERFIQGKREVIELALTCLIAEGHLLLEDVPGVGKTSLARSLAVSLGMSWHRIQFTPDLLPSDVTGVSVFHQGSSRFEFHPGPVFANIVLADEINRASPRTQSALLEVMEERTVTVDGVTHEVPRPFVVMATSNPIEMGGTFPLPEAQLDRFLMAISVGYPDPAAEVAVLANLQHGVRIDSLAPVASPQVMTDLIEQSRRTHVEPAVLDYIVRLTSSTRTARGILLGASPRGSVGLLRAAQASATIAGRTYVSPADVQRLSVPVLAHRILLTDADAPASARADAIRAVVDHVSVSP